MILEDIKTKYIKISLHNDKIRMVRDFNSFNDLFMSYLEGMNEHYLENNYEYQKEFFKNEIKNDKYLIHDDHRTFDVDYFLDLRDMIKLKSNINEQYKKYYDKLITVLKEYNKN